MRDQRRTYLVTYGGLLLLLAAAYGLSRLELGGWGPVLAMSIAVAKMLLIILYFMHVREESRLTWLFAGAGFFWLGILFVLAMSDYLSRGW